MPRKSSVILSQASEFYNNDVEFDGSLSQNRYEVTPEEEFDKLQNIKVAGFSFFGVRDYMG